MREQKYADILNKYEDEVKELDSLEQEEKLSMTREIKFKELHDTRSIPLKKEEIEDEEDFEVIEEERGKKEEPVKEEEELTDTQQLRRELLRKDLERRAKKEQEEREKKEKEALEPKKEIKEEVKEEIKEEKTDKKEENSKAYDHIDELYKTLEIKNNGHYEDDTEEIEVKKPTKEEDIYLTTSFKPLRKRFRFKKVFKVLFRLIFFLGVIAAIGYFVVWPLYNKYVNSQPKKVFDNSVDYVVNEIVKYVDKLENKDILYQNIKVAFNTNVEEYKSLNDIKYEYKAAGDAKNELYENTLALNYKGKDYSISHVGRNGNEYIKYSSSDNYIKVSKLNESKEFALFKEIVKNYTNENNYSKEDIKYIVLKHGEIIKELLNSEYIKAQRDEISVDGQTIKVMRNEFTVNAKQMDELIDKYFELVKADSRLAKLLNLKDIDTSKKEENKEYDEDYEMTINIYTKNGTDVVGFDIIESGFRRIYYYKSDTKFEAYINLTEDDKCEKGKDCVLNSQSIVYLYGNKRNDITDVKIEYNNIEVAELKIRSFTPEVIDFDYDIDYEDIVMKGKFKVEFDYDNEEIDLEFTYRVGNNYFTIKMYIDSKANSEIAKLNGNVIDGDKTVLDEEENKFYEELKENNLDKLFDEWVDNFSSSGLDNIFDNFDISELPSI